MSSNFPAKRQHDRSHDSWAMWRSDALGDASSESWALFGIVLQRNRFRCAMGVGHSSWELGGELLADPERGDKKTSSRPVSPELRLFSLDGITILNTDQFKRNLTLYYCSILTFDARPHSTWSSNLLFLSFPCLPSPTRLPNLNLYPKLYPSPYLKLYPNLYLKLYRFRPWGHQLSRVKRAPGPASWLGATSNIASVHPQTPRSVRPSVNTAKRAQKSRLSAGRLAAKWRAMRQSFFPTCLPYASIKGRDRV